MSRDEIRYISKGYLHGKIPSGVFATVHHATTNGGSGYHVHLEGKWHNDFGQPELKEIFGVSAKIKKSGSQKGYPAEPVIRALWRYLKEKYNRGDDSVTYNPDAPPK